MALYVLNVEALGRLSGLVTKRFVDVGWHDRQPATLSCGDLSTSTYVAGARWVRAKQGDDRPQLRRRPA
jgi:hypothetical protein